MHCLVGIDDTDSTNGFCTTYLAYRIACDLRDSLVVLPYPRLVRLNPNIPFKTRGNAAVCLRIETRDPDRAFALLSGELEELADVRGGANSGLVLLDNPERAPRFEPLYQAALSGVVNPARAKRLLSENGARSVTLGNGMGLVGATSSLAFGEHYDHTYELVSYRRRKYWGRVRVIDPPSVREMDVKTHPHTFNNYDYQKRKILIAPHGPDPVFAGVRGDSPAAVLEAFDLLRYDEELEGHMVYVSNQHTDAHLQRRLDWKAFSSGWTEVVVDGVRTGAGGHVYVSVKDQGQERLCAFYEPTADLRRAAKMLRAGDTIRLFGGVRRATTVHSKILNVEKMEVLSVTSPSKLRELATGVYISSPRANRHLTKPFARYGRECGGKFQPGLPGWLKSPSISKRELARSR
jgi:tRNA(Ile2)-agmatinylcytidine synthase